MPTPDDAPPTLGLILDMSEPAEPGRRFWTTRELALLRQHYPDGIEAAMKHLPSRSARAIVQQARHHQIKTTLQDRGRARYTTTPEIDRAIIAFHTSGSIAKGALTKLSATTRRPRGWIRRRSQQLGYQLPKFSEPRWSEEEDAILRENGHRQPMAIRRRLSKKGYSRSIGAIVSRITHIGARTDDPDHFTATGVAKMFGVDGSTVARWVRSGALKAGQRGIERQDKTTPDYWWISRRQLKLFIMQNVAAVDFRKIDKWWLVDLLTDPKLPSDEDALARGPGIRKREAINGT